MASRVRRRTHVVQVDSTRGALRSWMPERGEQKAAQPTATGSFRFAMRRSGDRSYPRRPARVHAFLLFFMCEDAPIETRVVRAIGPGAEGYSREVPRRVQVSAAGRSGVMSHHDMTVTNVARALCNDDQSQPPPISSPKNAPNHTPWTTRPPSSSSFSTSIRSHGPSRPIRTRGAKGWRSTGRWTSCWCF